MDATYSFIRPTVSLRIVIVDVLVGRWESMIDIRTVRNTLCASTLL
jgi:hypothetical protein